MRVIKLVPIIFFVWAFLLRVNTRNSSPIRSNLLRLQRACCSVPITFIRPHGSRFVWACQWLRHSLFHLFSCLITTVSELWEYTKVREQNLDYREGDELPWCPSWSNSLWQEWSSWLVRCPGGNAIDPIWKVLASSDGISSWTPLKPQHSNPNLLPNQLWSIDFLTHPTTLIIPYRLSAFLESLMPLKNWWSIHARWSKSNLKHSIRFWGIFPSLKQNCIEYRSSKVSDCIFEIHQLLQSGFSRMYSKSSCSCSCKPEIIKKWSVIL